jgi:S-adenosylmethionine:tRNA ribosyltransferase-isomerase
VFPARLLGSREPGGGRVECLLLGRAEDDRWEALVHPGQRLTEGSLMRFGAGPLELRGEILARLFHGRRLVRLWTTTGASVDETIDAIGHVPLPPYIKRADSADDRERYQTVFATRRGSVAAPTAGLHFTGPLIDRVESRGVEIVRLTLHVGYGTFKPVRVERVEEHTVDAETTIVDDEAASCINRALEEGRRIVAVGTTTTRALEALARIGNGRIVSGTRSVDLFIYPGFSFQVVGGLLTNFHLPRSSLLMLVSAFAGRARLLAAYREAVANRYRFYSYGDAMLIV